MLLQIALCAVIVFLVYDHFYRIYIHRMMKCIPTPDIPCFPFIGQAHTFLGNDEDRMEAFKKLGADATSLGGVVKLWFARRLFIIVTDPEVAEELLKTFLTKDDIMDVIRDLTGNGTIFAPVSIWRPRRKQLVPAFRPRNLKQFMAVFAKGSDELVQRLQDNAGAPQQLWKFLNTYAMDAACMTTLGIDLQVQKNPEQPFLKAFDVASKTMAERVCQPWLQVDWIYQLLPQFRRFRHARDILYAFVYDVIKTRRIQRKQEYENTIEADRDRDFKPQGLRSFLDMLLDIAEESGGISNEDLRDEIVVISVAGTDTSAVAAGFVLSMLAQHQDVQKKAFDEVHRIFGDSKRPITGQDLMELNYIDAVVRETLRLYPPVPVIVRKVTSIEKLSSLPTLVPGMGILINIWGVHRNPKYWGPDAEQFRPERFLESSDRHPAAFMPFSNGPRNCIAYQYAMMSIKTVVTNIVRHYHVSSPNECPKHKTSSERPANCTSCRVKPMRLKFDIMIKDHHQFKLLLEPRI